MARTPLMKKIKKSLSKKRKSRLSRRQFLGLGLVGGVGLYLNRNLFLGGSAPKVAILGAGASGLACAYQLKRHNIPFTVFEGSSRIGGRVFTKSNWNSAGQFIEIGGELIDSSHETTFELIKQLGHEQAVALKENKKFTPENLELLRFAEDPQKHLEKTLYLVDKSIYRDQDLEKAIVPLIREAQKINQKIWSEEHQELFYYNKLKLNEALKYDHMTIAQLFEGFEGKSENWILKLVQAAYESEFGREASQQSALNFLGMIDTDVSDGFSIFGESDESLRLKNGNSSLIRALMNSLSNYDASIEDAVFRKEHQLTGLVRTVKGYDLRFKNLPSENFTHVICCIPFQILRELDGVAELQLSPAKMQMIKNLSIGSNSKVMLDFKQRFWRDSGKLSNQGEHFLVQDSQVFWETSRRQEGAHGILTNFLTAKDADLADYNRSKKSISELVAIYGKSAADFHTGKSLFMDWQKNPWSKGSYACLSPGQYSQFWGSGSETEIGGTLIFAGEHTSLQAQGFIDGAYESGIRAANQLVKQLS